MNISASQLPERFRQEIQEQINIYNQKRTFEERADIPDTTDIPLTDKSRWLRIQNVICLYVDMLGSTQLSAATHESQTAGAYQLFTGSAVALLDQFEAPYIDVRGDGVFALFSSRQPYRALAAAVTFKTFSKNEFVPRIQTDAGVTIGCHIGIDMKRVLVRKLGLKRYAGRTDRQNEVWAGKPVNMAAKLASLSKDGEMLISDRYYNSITNDLARWSCGCVSGKYTGAKRALWAELDVSADPRFDFPKAYKLESYWCENHGNEYCEKLLSLDKE